jgi:hypothetical protein
MDRNREAIRDEAFELDPASQALLAEELVENLARTPNMTDWLEEAKRRLVAYRNGEMPTVDPSETFAKTKRMIEDARRTRA